MPVWKAIRLAYWVGIGHILAGAIGQQLLGWWGVLGAMGLSFAGFVVVQERINARFR